MLHSRDCFVKVLQIDGLYQNNLSVKGFKSTVDFASIYYSDILPGRINPNPPWAGC